MATRNLMLNQLDRALEPWKTANTRPKAGWIKTIRNALGITAEQLAKTPWCDTQTHSAT